MAKVIVTGGRSIASHDILALNLSRDRDVSANGETQHIVWFRQRKTIPDATSINELRYVWK